MAAGEGVAGAGALVAVVDDDALVRRAARRCLAVAGWTVQEYASGREALEHLDRPHAAMCLDLRLGDMSGLDVLRHALARDAELPVILTTGERGVDTAVEAMRAGAYDYLVKPVDDERLRHVVRLAVERRELSARVRELRARLDDAPEEARIVGQSAPIRELARQVERVRESDVTVCLLGESGTGKELVARALHTSGRRRHGPFVALNCGAIPAGLQESELFGHERGAFTGAAATHRGRFEQAHGGTLFLDELGELSAATQASLLRTLQERTVRRVGGTADIPVDVRIIAATHRDLEAEVAAGRFREDLYYRLVVYPISLPPLRSRSEDVPLLVGHFLQKYRVDVGREVLRVSPDALEALTRHPWPGNVRELENVVHRAMLSCDGPVIALAHLPSHVRARVLSDVPAAPASGPPAPLAEPEGEDSVVPLRDLERMAIQRALKVTRGNVARAADLLGIGRATLYRRLAEG